MGITVHYSGSARNWDSLTQLLSTAQVFCAQREWMFAVYDDPLGIMEDRHHDDPGYIEHDGPFRGMVVRPHPRCEPVRLDFNTSNQLTAASTKTQFAPFEIHVQIVELLRAVEPFMAEFSVIDESGLWETGDVPSARAQFEALGEVIGQFSDELRDAGLDVEGPGVPLDPYQIDDEPLDDDKRPLR